MTLPIRKFGEPFDYSTYCNEIEQNPDLLETYFDQYLDEGRKHPVPQILNCFRHAELFQNDPSLGWPNENVSSFDELYFVFVKDLVQKNHHPFLARKYFDKIFNRVLQLINQISYFEKKELGQEYTNTLANFIICTSLLNISPQKFLQLLFRNPNLNFSEINFDSNFHEDNPLKKIVTSILKDKGTFDLKKEVHRYLDYFLYSFNFPDFFYEAFLTLAGETEMTMEEIIQERKQKRTESEKYFISKIEEMGPITYAQFMELALYDPMYGFYTKQRSESIVGKAHQAVEFTTLPSEFEHFGYGVAIAAFNQWKAMGKPSVFSVIEMGAGQGDMAFSFFNFLNQQKNRPWQKFRKALQYQIIEISSNLIEQQKRKLKKYGDEIKWVHSSALDLKNKIEPITGLFISNELPDAFPVHKIKRINEKFYEVYVQVENGFLQETLRDISSSEIMLSLVTSGIELIKNGETRIVNLNARQWIHDLSTLLQEGSIITFDYGYTSEEREARGALQIPFRTFGQKKIIEPFDALGVKYDDNSKRNLKRIQAVVEEDTPEVREKMRKILSLDPINKINEMCRLFQETEEFAAVKKTISDYWQSPLVHPGEIDITTDVDFSSLKKVGIESGLIETHFGSLDKYFETLLPAKVHPNIPSAFFEKAKGHKVQILTKKRPLSHFQKIINAVLRRGH